MGIIVQKCLYDYDCSKCRGKQTNCVAYAQKQWHDVAVLNQMHLVELEEYKDRIAKKELAPAVHGRWIDDMVDDEKARVCSVCGSIIPTATQVDFLSEECNRFCYFCGAKLSID